MNQPVAGFQHLGDVEVASLARLRVMRSTFVAPDGSRFERDVIRNQEVVAMVPLLADGRSVLMVRQYRGPIDSLLLEIPAGLCDVEGEVDPLTTAARELEEEVGQAASAFELIAQFHPAAGFCDQFVRIYLATGLTAVDCDPQGVEEEHMTTEVIALDDVPAMIADGSLTDAKSIIGLLVTARRLGTPAG